MKAYLLGLKARLDKALHQYFSKIEHSAHFAYFGAAALGAHDIYAMVAGFMVVLLIIGYITHIGE